MERRTLNQAEVYPVGPCDRMCPVLLFRKDMVHTRNKFCSVLSIKQLHHGVDMNRKSYWFTNMTAPMICPPIISSEEVRRMFQFWDSADDRCSSITSAASILFPWVSLTPNLYDTTEAGTSPNEYFKQSALETLEFARKK